MVLLTIKDAADRLQMSTGYVKLAIRKGELRAMKFGRCVRISEQDFEEYCAGKIEGSTQSDRRVPVELARFFDPIKPKGYRQ